MGLKTEVPIEPLRLGFDPQKAADLPFQQVFGDEIAKSLWLMIKPGHIVDATFESWCLLTASFIRTQTLATPEELHRLIRPAPPYLPTDNRFLSENWEDSREWLERLLKAIDGSEPIRYEVVV